jgi:hypothetical protein
MGSVAHQDLSRTPHGSFRSHTRAADRLRPPQLNGLYQTLDGRFTHALNQAVNPPTVPPHVRTSAKGMTWA